MYAPVALRFHTYQLDVGEVEQDYMMSVLNHPAIQEWIEAGKRETEVIQAFEA
jgi:glutathione S-transferase